MCYIMLRQQNQLRRKIVCVQFEMMWVKLMIAQSVVLGVGNRQKGTFILGFIAAAAATTVYHPQTINYTTSMYMQFGSHHLLLLQLNCFP